MKKVVIFGGSGLIGGYIYKTLFGKYAIESPTSKELDLRDEKRVDSFLEKSKPDYVILAAAMKAGVAEYERKPVEYLSNNIAIQNSVVSCCFRQGVQRLLFLGASSVYPSSEGKDVKEDDYRSGWVQKATEPYSLAKAVGTNLCEYYNYEYGTNYVVAALSNVYGWSDDHFDKTSVIPSLIDKFQNAVKNKLSSVTIWGTGENKREFMYVKDCANALVVLMESDICGIVNVGSGEMVSINELAGIISRIVGFEGSIEHDLSKPEGSQRSMLDISRLKMLGWEPRYSLEEGLRETIRLSNNM